MNKKLGYSIAFVLALGAPFVGYPVLLMKLLCFALFACAFNLLMDLPVCSRLATQRSLVRRATSPATP